MSALTIPRRDFLFAGSAAAAGIALARASGAIGSEEAHGDFLIETFDYQGVKLHPSRWQRQYKSAGDFYTGVADDDILHGWRAAAGLPAPGKSLGGWCDANSNTVFGQWLQGLSRMGHADDDTAARDKAIALFTQWAETVGPDGNCRMGQYPLEKLVGGLVDLKHTRDTIRRSRCSKGSSTMPPKTLIERALLLRRVPRQSFRTAARMVHRRREPLSRVSADRQHEVQGLRGRLAVSRVLGQVP